MEGYTMVGSLSDARRESLEQLSDAALEQKLQDVSRNGKPTKESERFELFTACEEILKSRRAERGER